MLNFATLLSAWWIAVMTMWSTSPTPANALSNFLGLRQIEHQPRSAFVRFRPRPRRRGLDRGW